MLVRTPGVLGPHWVDATRIELYANGQLIREEKITLASKGTRMGVKWEGSWTIPRPKHDVHLVAIATGPEQVDGPLLADRQPYQPTSPDWEARVIGRERGFGSTPMATADALPARD